MIKDRWPRREQLMLSRIAAILGQHSYQWTVEAQDGTGKTLAVATVTKKFPLQ